MKTIKKLITAVLLLVVGVSFAQGSEKCKIDYNLFVGDVKAKKYVSAKPALEKLMVDCPKLTVNLYKYGAILATDTKDHDLVKKVYEARKSNYPNKEIGEAHNEYVSYLIDNKLGTDDDVFELLKVAYEYPKDMTVRNVYMYFNAIYKRNKDTNPALVFNTYDDVMETAVEKQEDFNAKMKPFLDKKIAGTLTNEDDIAALNYYEYGAVSLGKLERLLDRKVGEIAKCEYLVPLFNKEYEANKTNSKWLGRSVTRLSKKGCEEDPLFEKLVKSYAEVSKSADAYIYLAGILEKKGKVSEANQMKGKAFELETDPFKKAKMKYIEAYTAKRSGKKSKARSLARQALKFNPNLGKAYLLISDLYKSSANSCGTTMFEKRMVYVAALNKAKRARAVDPSCGAGRFISYLKKQVPDTTLIFKSGVQPGSSHKVGCWIGETVKVPKY